jgi:hypothetical protein
MAIVVIALRRGLGSGFKKGIKALLTFATAC